jgi:3-oxoadipate enol-lactonase
VERIANLTHTPQAKWDAERKIAYLESGERGPVVVLLHGWGAFKELWWSTLCALAPHYRAYALDMPGHADSQVAGDWTIAGIAKIVEDFCDAHGLKEICLVGHSMGGNVALQVALRRPDLLSSLVLVDAVADAQALPRYVGTYVHPIVGWPVLRFAKLTQSMLRPLGDMVPHLHGNGWVRPFLRRIAYSSRHEALNLHTLLRGMFANPLGEAAKSLHVSTLVISGRFDSVVPAAEARRIAALLPNARYAEIPWAMHNPMDETPAAFERLLLDFLSERY